MTRFAAIYGGTIALLVLGVIGCAGPARPVGEFAAVESDGRRGGAAADERLGRLERLTRIAAPVLAQARLARPVRLAVLDTPRVGAYSFPDGRVFVSRGLAELLTRDDELAAAVAHELGHLYRPGTEARSLGGASDPPVGEPDEFRADATAGRLLAAAGFDPGALADLLRKVAASPDTTSHQDRRIAERIRRLPRRSATPDD